MAAAPVIAAGASILGGALGGKGAAKAAKTQAAAYQKGLEQQQAQYNTTRSDLSPFREAGSQALGSVGDLLGLNGGGIQDSAISALKASPLFTSQYDTGVDTILQNQAATGGLRGGNTQNSLAQFGSGLLSDVIQRQLGNLGGLVTTGAGAAGQLGQLGQQNANATSSLLAQQGGANALGAAAPYGAAQGTINQLGALFGRGGGLSGLFSGGAPPLGVSSSIVGAQPIGSTSDLGALLARITTANGGIKF